MKNRFIALLLALTLSGCAAERAYDEGVGLVQTGRTSEGLAKIEEAYRLDPHSQLYRQAYFRHRDAALQRELAAAEHARQQGKWQAAEAAYGRMLAIDPRSIRALNGLEALRQEKRAAELVVKANDSLKKGDYPAAQAAARQLLAEDPSHREAQRVLRQAAEAAKPAEEPRLAAAFREPIKLDFREGTLRQIFDVIARSTGVDFIFDRDVRLDQRVTVFVRHSSTEDVMRFLLVTNQLERKVLADNMVLVYPNTPAKQRDYQDLVARTFYISNGDAKSIASMIKTVVKTKDLHIDEKVNAIVMRDTADAVRMAERLVSNLDIADAEVMLEVEVLEVGSTTLYDLGIQYPDKLSISVVGAEGTPGTLTLPEWRSGRSDLVRISVSDPLFGLNLRNVLGQSNLLANPRIRVKNKDKAKVHIGDKIPVVTTTTTATGFATQSVSYLDVGLKLEVEPVVSLEDDVSIKVGLEVSSIAREIRSGSTLTYQVGTRNASTTLRLRDGETQVLAGLISDEERKSVAQVPGLGNLPLVGRLFGNHSDNSAKTEIVLLITPRIVRNLARPEARYEKFASGTEAAIGASPLAVYLPKEIASIKPMPTPAKPPQVSLQSAANVTAGSEFKVGVVVNTALDIARGDLHFAFDPGRLTFVRAEPGTALAANKDVEFKATAAGQDGRVSVNFSGKTAITDPGELISLTFQARSDAAGTPLVRLESLSLQSTAGTPVSLPAPPPLKFTVSR
jgi:general secretion pathway protein D